MRRLGDLYLPAALQRYASAEVDAFAPDFRTPRTQQGSIGVDLMRARDVNLPPPTDYNYPIYDPTGSTFQNQFYNVESFATWKRSYSLSCPYPPYLNSVDRPISQL
jgi:hypothetical protein